MFQNKESLIGTDGCENQRVVSFQRVPVAIGRKLLSYTSSFNRKSANRGGSGSIVVAFLRGGEAMSTRGLLRL